jgi:probable addiction module antidote protein
MTKTSRKATHGDYNDLIADKFKKDPEFLKLCLKNSFKNYAKDGNEFLLRETLKQAAQAKGMTQLARETGLSRQYLYEMVSERGNPTIATFRLVLKSLGFRMYIKAI